MKQDVRITRCYLVEHIDGSGKALSSDFCFGTRADAEKLGEDLKKRDIAMAEQDGVVFGA